MRATSSSRPCRSSSATSLRVKSALLRSPLMQLAPGSHRPLVVAQLLAQLGQRLPGASAAGSCLSGQPGLEFHSPPAPQGEPDHLPVELEPLRRRRRTGSPSAVRSSRSAASASPLPRARLAASRASAAGWAGAACAPVSCSTAAAPSAARPPRPRARARARTTGRHRSGARRPAAAGPRSPPARRPARSASAAVACRIAPPPGRRTLPRRGGLVVGQGLRQVALPLERPGAAQQRRRRLRVAATRPGRTRPRPRPTGRPPAAAGRGPARRGRARPAPAPACPPARAGGPPPAGPAPRRTLRRQGGVFGSVQQRAERLLPQSPAAVALDLPVGGGRSASASEISQHPERSPADRGG